MNKQQVDSHRSPEMLARFQQIRRRYSLALLAFGLLAIPLVWKFCEFVGPHSPGAEWPQHQLIRAIGGSMVLLLFVAVALICLHRIWRCPACSEMLDIRIDPTFCTHCGVQLQEHRGLQPESKFVVRVNDMEVSCERPEGRTETILWNDLEAVVIETTDAGPFAPDVFW